MRCCCCPTPFMPPCSRTARGFPSAGDIVPTCATPLLTRAMPKPRAARLHQAEYYQQLTRALGIASGPLVAEVRVDEARRAGADRLLREHGWDGRPLVGVAPGAAYGWAKRWLPERMGALAARLAHDSGACVAVVGAAADRETVDTVVRTAGAAGAGPGAIINLAGKTDLPALAAVLSRCRAFVSNDSGAMHLAAAVDVPVVAIFGPTREWATSPLPGPRAIQAAIVHTDVSCRPCMLRTCPIDHRCMTRHRGGGCDDARTGRAQPATRSDGGAMKPAVFLDRDGTVIEERGYLGRLDLIELLPGSAEAIRLLKAAGYAGGDRDQPGGDRARAVRRSVRAVRPRAARCDAAGGGAAVDGYYYCPHHPDGVVERYRLVCGCRKPAPGMVRQAAAALDLDVARSFVVGDKWLDIGLARNCRRNGVLVRTGYAGGDEAVPPPGCEPAVIVDTLLDAAHWILAAPAAVR